MYKQKSSNGFKSLVFFFTKINKKYNNKNNNNQYKIYKTNLNNKDNNNLY
jgi:hypothetical protein